MAPGLLCLQLQVRPSLSNTLGKRSTVPRSLAIRTGSSLPYSTRLAGRPAEGSSSGSIASSPAVQGSVVPLTSSSLAARRTYLNRDAGAATRTTSGAVGSSSMVEVGAGSSTMQSRMVGGPHVPNNGISSPVKRSTTRPEQSPLPVQGSVLEPEQLLAQQLPPSAFTHGGTIMSAAQGGTPAAVAASGSRPSSAAGTPLLAAGDGAESLASTDSGAAQADDTVLWQQAEKAAVASPVKGRIGRERVPELL